MVGQLTAMMTRMTSCEVRQGAWCVASRAGVGFALHRNSRTRDDHDIPPSAATLCFYSIETCIAMRFYICYLLRPL